VRPGTHGRSIRFLVIIPMTENSMQSRSTMAALVSAALLASTAFATAQSINAGGGTVGTAGVIMSPAAPAPSAGVATSPATTGMSTGISQPGARSTTPGHIGTGTSASGLPGDNPSAPGFPGKVGK
jgi:hypothetical protein